MIKGEFVETIFQAASIQRWNDQIKVVEFSELDKHAHKMCIAWILGHYYSSQNVEKVNWPVLIKQGIFQFLQRTVLTDLKSPVYHKFIEDPENKKNLNKFIYDSLKNKIENIGNNFNEDFIEFMEETKSPNQYNLERNILLSANYLVTQWEFNLIKFKSPDSLYGLKKISNDIENELEKYEKFSFMQMYNTSNKMKNFSDLCGQLRFQKRWPHSERIPKTSVLGHSLIVALLSYFFTIDIKPFPCEQRIYNNFFGGLFHDLPEFTTRDIVSPVKKSITGLNEFLKDYQKEKMREEVLTLIPEECELCKSDLDYFTIDEFLCKIVKNDSIITSENEKNITESHLINKEYNFNEYLPIDGSIVEISDIFAAFIEACLSIVIGIKSKELEKGKIASYSKLISKNIGDFDFLPLIDYFL